MKIESFRIKNYRSIRDSGVCYLSGDDVTILAGKNESGKTSILEALEDFDSKRQIREKALPLFEKNEPEIAITFKFNNEDLNDFLTDVGLNSTMEKNTGIEIIKRHPNAYSISHETIQEFGLQNQTIIKEILNQILDSIKDSNHPSSIDFFLEIDLNNIDMEYLRSNCMNFIELSKEERELIDYSDEEYSNILQLYNDLVESIDQYSKLSHEFNIDFTDIEKWIPNFILFSSFDDIFPSEVLLTDANDNELINDLSIISELNLELIASGTPAAKTQHKEKLNIQLKSNYEKYWTQDLTNLHVDWDSDNLFFFIKENDNFFPPDMRSKGKQWHLAFYVKVSARSNEDVPNIILIDEPGLFLHANAQKDILKKLEASANDAQIIFSSHSPYLIEIQKLNRIRLVSRTEEKGTVISNKIHKDADKETLTPIITAIGLDLSLGIDIAKENNIILEGMSDYYYLCALKEYLDFEFKKEVHFIPMQGADKSKLLIPLMIGWGLNYCTVLDNDKKGRKVDSELKKYFGYNGVKTIFVSDKKNEEIEDLFEKNDFIECVLCEKSKDLSIELPNSKLLKQKDKKYDKVLLSKLFYENTKNGQFSFSVQTIDNFKDLLSNIDKLMFPEI